MRTWTLGHHPTFSTVPDPRGGGGGLRGTCPPKRPKVPLKKDNFFFHVLLKEKVEGGGAQIEL